MPIKYFLRNCSTLKGTPGDRYFKKKTTAKRVATIFGTRIGKLGKPRCRVEKELAERLKGRSVTSAQVSSNADPDESEDPSCRDAASPVGAFVRCAACGLAEMVPVQDQRRGRLDGPEDPSCKDAERSVGRSHAEHGNEVSFTLRWMGRRKGYRAGPCPIRRRTCRPNRPRRFEKHRSKGMGERRLVPRDARIADRR